MATLETVKKVTSENGLKALYDNIGAVEKEIVHGDTVELYYEFKFRVPGLRTIANQINSDLAGRKITKWAGATDYTIVENDNHILRVRFVEGSPWLGIIFALVMGLIAAFLIWLVLSEIRKLVPEGSVIDTILGGGDGLNIYFISGLAGIGLILYLTTRG